MLDECSRGGLFGLGARSAHGGDEELRLEVTAKLVAQDPKRAVGIAEFCGDLLGGDVLDEVSSQGLVLALFGELRFQEEAPARC